LAKEGKGEMRLDLIYVFYDLIGDEIILGKKCNDYFCVSKKYVYYCIGKGGGWCFESMDEKK
jgi:hypothetical protein